MFYSRAPQPRMWLQIWRLLSLSFVLSVFQTVPVAAATTLSDIAITDLTPRSFVLLVRADRQVNVSVSVFSNAMGTQAVSGLSTETQFTVSGNLALANAAQVNGLVRVRVKGLEAGKPYFYRATITPIGGGAAFQLPAAPPYPSFIAPRGSFPVDNPTVGVIVTQDTGQVTDGSVVLLELPGRASPVSHLVGDGFPSNTAALNLSNVFDPTLGRNSATVGGTGVLVTAQGGLRGRAETVASLPNGPELGLIWFASTLALNGGLDSDADGMPDDFESRYGLNPAANDASLDLDSDGVTNLQEYQLGSNPQIADTDGDGLNDGAELGIGSLLTQADTDQDGLTDAQENNNYNSNPLQADSDGDGVRDGDEVAEGTDPNDSGEFQVRDMDGDGIPDATDNCLQVPNVDQRNSDNDVFGNACDTDDDNDGVPDGIDNAPLHPNSGQADNDLDGIGNVADNCSSVVNPDQANNDADSQGDACDPDDDNDSVSDFDVTPLSPDLPFMVTRILDVPSTTIPVQASTTAYFDFYKFDRLLATPIKLGRYDLKRRTFTPEPLSADEAGLEGGLMITRDAAQCNCMSYGIGSTLEIATNQGGIVVPLPAPTSWPVGTLRFVAIDGSLFTSYITSIPALRLSGLAYSAQIPPHLDNCQFVPNTSQLDSDGDGKGDACESTPTDQDGDDVPNVSDNCPAIHNPTQANLDGDPLGDACDPDADGDGIANTHEIDVLHTNPYAVDSNGDGQGDMDEDFDFDGMSNREELDLGRDPRVPEIDLQEGLNLVHFPTQLAANLSAFDLLSQLGGSNFVRRIERLIPATEQVPAAFFTSGGLPEGENFAITTDQAYMVVMSQARRQTWTGAPLCRSIQLVEGKQLLGLGCVPKGMTAHKLLEALGANSIATLQRLNPKTKRLDTVAYDGGAVVGRDFQLNGVAGYIAHLNQTASTDVFNLRAPTISLNLTDGQIVSDENLTFTGFVNDRSAYVSVNGRAAQMRNTADGASFSLEGLELEEGDNTVTVRVRGANNLLVTRTITVRYAVAPTITIQSHYEGQVTPSAKTTIQGAISDPLAKVTVNGIAATVRADGSFDAANVPLPVGTNTIEVIAIGANQGVARKSITIHSEPATLFLPAGVTSAQYIFDFYLTSAQYQQAARYSINYRGGSAFSYTTNSVVIYPPNRWRYTFTIGVPQAGSPLGESEFVITFNVLSDTSQMVRTEDIRVRVARYESVMLAFDPGIEGLVTKSSSVQFEGRAIGLAQAVSVNGTAVPLSGSLPTQHTVRKFRASVPLQMGNNFVHVVATSTTGETYHRDLKIFRDNASSLHVKITSPRTKDVLASSSLIVQGTVTVPSATVTVNGVRAAVTPNTQGEGGLFEVAVPVTASGRIQAIATFGSDSAGDQVDVLRAPFDMTFDLGYDRSISRRSTVRFLGQASVPMQMVRINGVNLSVAGSTFDGSVQSVGTAGAFGRYLVEATTLAGDVARFDVLVKYEPHRHAIQNPGRARIAFEVDAPIALGEVASWALPPMAAWSPNLRNTPFYGRITPDAVEKIGPGKYRLYADVEAHGFSSPATVTAASTVELRNSSGQPVHSALHDFVWTVETKQNYRGVFITSVSEGDITHLRSGPVFGVLANVQAQSVEINGQPVDFNESAFWWFSGFQAGANRVEVTVTDVYGEVHTDTVRFRSEPKRITLLLDPQTGAHQVDLSVLQRGNQVPGQGAFIQLEGLPSSYDWANADFSNVYVSTFNRYFLSAPNTYYELRYPTYWPRDPVLSNELGTWEVMLRNGYNHSLWVNFVDPSVPTSINVLSHTDGQSVSGDTAVIQVTTPNNGASEVTINGIIAQQSFSSRPCCGDRTRIDQVHTATIPLAMGVNTVTITASGPVSGTATSTIIRTE